jgi:hypothetical protein
MSAEKLEVGDIRITGSVFYIIIGDCQMNHNLENGNLRKLWLSYREAGPILPETSPPSLGDKYICNLSDAFLELEKILYRERMA